MSLQVAYFKARDAGMQSSRVATAPCHLLEFSHWNPASCQIVISCNFFMHTMVYFSHIHEHPTSTSLGHRCGVSITIYTLEDCCATLVCPEPVLRIWNTYKSVSPWDAFMLVFFSPHNFFLINRGVFPCWPHILNTVYVEIFARRKILPPALIVLSS